MAKSYCTGFLFCARYAVVKVNHWRNGENALWTVCNAYCKLACVSGGIRVKKRAQDEGNTATECQNFF